MLLGLAAHKVDHQQGGNVIISSGDSIEASSGEVTIGSASAGRKGDSGILTLSTGDANTGDAGMIGESVQL